MNLNIVILTHNEEENLLACLESLHELAGDVFVVDSGSTDRTLDIAKAFGATTVFHPFETHARQWQWALNHLAQRYEWTLCLDADQRVTQELAAEICAVLDGKHVDALAEIDGLYMKRRQIFRGKWVRHGGYYPKYLLKLFRRQKVKIDLGDLMDHHFYVEGRVAKLRHDLIEENKKENDIAFWIEKHIRYATLLAQEELQRRARNDHEVLRPRPMGNPDQRALWLKRIWRRLPLYVRPFMFFVYRYFFRLGFLDGKEGFVFHFLQGFWFRLLVDIKIDEMRTAARGERVPAVGLETARGVRRLD